jgi:hypothetical protein
MKHKVNQDNTVNITSVQKKMYSKEEVESLLYKYADEEHAQFSSKFFIETFNNWIKVIGRKRTVYLPLLW